MRELLAKNRRKFVDNSPSILADRESFRKRLIKKKSPVSARGPKQTRFSGLVFKLTKFVNLTIYIIYSTGGSVIRYREGVSIRYRERASIRYRALKIFRKRGAYKVQLIFFGNSFVGFFKACKFLFE